MRAASAATAVQVAAAANGIFPFKPVSYTFLADVRLTDQAQLAKLTLSGGANTGTASTQTGQNCPGGQSSFVRVTTVGYNGSSYGIAFASPWDLSSSHFRYQIRTDHTQTRSGFLIQLAATKAAYDAGNYLVWRVAAGNATPNYLPQNTWCWDSFNPLLASTVGTAPALSSIGYVAFVFNDIDGSTTSTYDLARIQNLRNDGVKAKCVIWHDDAHTQGADAIYLKLQKYGWAATEATIWENLGAAIGFPYGKYQLDGWQLASHSNLGVEHTDVPATSVESQAIRNKAASMQYRGDGQDEAYWGGLNPTYAYPIFDRSYRSARWFTNGLVYPETQPPGDLHMTKAMGTTGGDTFNATWKPLLQNAITIKGIAQIVFHQQIWSDTTQAAEFDNMLAWLDANRASIDVVTIKQVLDPLSIGYVAPAPALPTTPFTLSVVNGNGQLTINRSGGFADGTAFKLYRGTTPTGTPIATSLPFTDTGLTNGTAVSYVATSTNSVGTVTSNVASGTPTAPAPTAVDNFNRADSTSSLGTASDGGAWTVLNGTWGISSNRAYNAGGGGGAQVVRDLASTNHFVEARVTYATSNVLIARCADKNNWYGLAPNSGKLDFYKFIGGSATFITSIGVTATAGDLVRFTVNGSTLSASLNGTVVKTVTDTSITTGTKVGMRADNGTGWFDDFNASA